MNAIFWNIGAACFAVFARFGFGAFVGFVGFADARAWLEVAHPDRDGGAQREVSIPEQLVEPPS